MKGPVRWHRRHRDKEPDNTPLNRKPITESPGEGVVNMFRRSSMLPAFLRPLRYKISRYKKQGFAEDFYPPVSTMLNSYRQRPSHQGYRPAQRFLVERTCFESLQLFIKSASPRSQVIKPVNPLNERSLKFLGAPRDELFPRSKSAHGIFNPI